MSSGSSSFTAADRPDGRSLEGLLRFEEVRWVASDAVGRGRLAWGAGLRERDSCHEIRLDLNT